MKIAIKFDEQGKYLSHCNNFDITTLEKIMPNNEGFNFYEYNGSLEDIIYLSLINGDLIINEQEKQATTLKQEKQMEIKKIKKWFEDYDRKVSEHNRCLRLNIPCHHDIAALDTEAAAKADRLKELREGVNNEI